MAIVRGCGTRVKGGTYLFFGTSPYGRPVEAFLKDYPQPLDPALRVSPRGITFIERGGVYHVLDWVGQSFYPNVYDYIEEVRLYGGSRHVSSKIDFSKLTPRSKHLLIHPRAIVTNWQEYYIAEEKRAQEISPLDPFTDWRGECCPKHTHDAHHGPCLAIGRFTLTNADLDIGGMYSHRVIRSMPSFAYGGWRAPRGFVPQYAPGIFMSLPITAIQVVKGNHEAVLKAAQRSSLPVEEVDE